MSSQIASQVTGSSRPLEERSRRFTGLAQRRQHRELLAALAVEREKESFNYMRTHNSIYGQVSHSALIAPIS